MTKRNPLYLLLVTAVSLGIMSGLVGCNDDDNDDDVFTYSSSTSTTLVHKFGLQADKDVLTSLDSVYFTIDYDKGLIYNADSLPVGTDVSKLKVVVEFLNTVSSAVFDITDATSQADTTINYETDMTQALDFTGKTTLTVTSYDRSAVKKYEVKVLVHKYNPDSLVFAQSWRRDLPGYNSAVARSKTVQMGGRFLTLNYDGANATLWSAAAPNEAAWQQQAIDLPFAPDVASLTAAGDALYMLDADGALYSSVDGAAWTSCGVVWYSMLGAYGDRVLGIINDGGVFYHDEYPRLDGYAPSAIEDGFPVCHASCMVQTDNDWATSQQSILVGGIDANGSLRSDVWGYDGSRWGRINNVHSTAVPAIADATLFAYYTSKILPGVRRYGTQITWYLMGGKLADGTLNDKIYLSNTQGITWVTGDSTIAQPAHMPRFYGAQAFVNSETLTADAASLAPRRLPALITSWECPYVYIFGGYNSENALLPNVWRGVYNRLANYPVY